MKYNLATFINKAVKIHMDAAALHSSHLCYSDRCVSLGYQLTSRYMLSLSHPTKIVSQGEWNEQNMKTLTFDNMTLLRKVNICLQYCRMFS